MKEVIVRQGISPGWGRYWARASKGMLEAIPAHQPKRLSDLAHYIAHGHVPVAVENAIPVESVNPPRAAWESNLSSVLHGYAQAKEFEFECRLADGVADYALALEAFSSAYLWQMIQLEIHRLFPQRFGGRNLRMMSMQDVPYTALGVVLGCEPQATQLATAQAFAYRKGYYRGTQYYPIHVFLLRVLAEALEGEPIHLEGEALQEPILQHLFEIWKTPDVSLLASACLAALDLHTHRCKQGSAKKFFEFEGANWIRLPIEIWLIFKLRKRMGLLNPTLDHEMMAGPFGVVPLDMGFRAEGPIATVYARMKQDGFSDEAILAGLHTA
jgi:hypothetical protein